MGIPKGVMVEHKNAVRLVQNSNYIDIDSGDILLQLSNYAFDGSVFDIYGALLNGAKLVMVTEDDLRDINRLISLIKDENVTLFFITTALFNVLVDTDANVSPTSGMYSSAGERVSFEHVKTACAQLEIRPDHSCLRPH